MGREKIGPMERLRCIITPFQKPEWKFWFYSATSHSIGQGLGGGPHEIKGGRRKDGQNAMRVVRRLFSFQGRSGRSAFWFIHLALAIIALAVISLRDSWTPYFHSFSPSPGTVTLLLVALPWFWVMLAAYARRLHDVGLPAYRIWVLFIPVPFPGVVWIGCLIMLGSRRGTKGPNKYDDMDTRTADIDDDKTYDLVFLHYRQIVRAGGAGQSITVVHAEVENLTSRTINVAITPGTYFVSTGNHQNMATTEDRRFTLSSFERTRFDISAACINAARRVPRKHDRFRGVAHTSDVVARFLAASEDQNPMAIQAGVWTLSDNYSRYDVMNHLGSRDQFGTFRPSITNEDCDRAKMILNRLGIPNRLDTRMQPQSGQRQSALKGTWPPRRR
jgi:uncharacterized membrane protein YhaH (DUF805 family)